MRQMNIGGTQQNVGATKLLKVYISGTKLLKVDISGTKLWKVDIRGNQNVESGNL